MKYEKIMTTGDGRLCAIKHLGAAFKDGFQVVVWTPNHDDEEVIFSSWSRNKCYLKLLQVADI